MRRICAGSDFQFDEDITKERVVDLHEETGLDDGQVFGAQRLADRRTKNSSSVL